MSYKPKPIDTSKVELSKDIIELTDILAKNAHDIWAFQRMKEGWRYGSKRDDVKKENPCLVPYEDMPESEKDLDRKAAMDTLKAVMALGYTIENREKLVKYLKK
ncbi:MAG: RyR domain-containing protein [Candidatus Methanoperedens sp.]